MYSQKIVLRFTKKTWDKPIVYQLAKDYDLVFYILSTELCVGCELCIAACPVRAMKASF
jgi:formate hydrogenlyase subunit 6/NADH:ubiquinone oxidoreductase subunit I